MYTLSGLMQAQEIALRIGTISNKKVSLEDALQELEY